MTNELTRVDTPNGVKWYDEDGVLKISTDMADHPWFQEVVAASKARINKIYDFDPSMLSSYVRERIEKERAKMAETAEIDNDFSITKTIEQPVAGVWAWPDQVEVEIEGRSVLLTVVDALDLSTRIRSAATLADKVAWTDEDEPKLVRKASE